LAVTGFDRTKKAIHAELGLGAGAFSVLVVLASYTNGVAEAHPSVPTIAKKIGCAESAVHRAILLLKKKNLIEKVGLHGNPGRQTVTYRIALPNQEATPPDIEATPPDSVPLPLPNQETNKPSHQTKNKPPLTPHRGEWEKCVEVGRSNPSVAITKPSKWGPTRNRQLRAVSLTLKATGKTWDDLRRSIAAVKLGSECTPWDLSLDRLTSKENARLDDLLGGKNADPKKKKNFNTRSQQEIEDEADRISARMREARNGN
jgi:hypothetical protein